MVPLDKDGNYAGAPQPVNVKDSQGNVFNSLGVYYTDAGGLGLRLRAGRPLADPLKGRSAATGTIVMMANSN